MDYSDILNSISSKLSSILNELGSLSVIEHFEALIFYVFCVFLILFAIRGE